MNQGSNKSNFFNLSENVAAMLTALIPLGVSFIGYVSYAAWAVPLVVMLLEKQSKFVKLCAAQSFVMTFVSFICSIVTGNINNLTDGAHGIMFIPLEIIGLVMSIVQLACLVLLVLLAVNSYRMKVLEIPVLTDFLRKYTQY